MLLLCLSSGNERRRHEEGLSVLTTLSQAPNELSLVHLGGVPLTPQSTRALKALLLAAAPVALPPSSTSGPAAAAAATAPAAKPPPPAVRLAPLLPPLRLHLYGYDVTRQPASASLEALAPALAPRLAHLELWGCVGWPKHMGPALQSCARLRHLAVSFPPLVPTAGGHHLQLGLLQPVSASSAASAAAAAAAAAAASGAVAVYDVVAAAATANAVVHSLGLLRQLRSLELRGCSINLSRPGGGGQRTSGSGAAAGGRGGGGGGSRRPISKSAAARQAEEAAAPTPQQLASALYQLTGLTRLALDGLPSAGPLLTALSAIRGLRVLELPDAAAVPQDLAAIAVAAPRLRALTLAGIGQGAVLGLRDAGERAAVAAARPPEPLPLPPDLVALRVVRDRPTLRTMRALGLAVERRRSRCGSPALAPGGAAAAAGSPGGTSSGSPVMAAEAVEVAVVVPGFEVDLPDVEFDPLLAFHRAEDGVMRSTLLPESAEAMAAAIRLLAAPPSRSPSRSPWPSPLSWSPSQQPQPRRTGLSFCSSALSSCSIAASSLAAPSLPASPAAAVLGRGGGGGGGNYAAAALLDSDGCCYDESCCGGSAPACGSGSGSGFGLWQQELVIHNVQGSLEPPTELPPAVTVSTVQEEEEEAAAAAAAVVAPSSETPPSPPAPPSGLSGGAEGGPVTHGSPGAAALGGYGPLGLGLVPWRPAGHAVWILELRRLGLRALELYGIGLQVDDLAAVASLETLQRLALVGGELAVEGLPHLAALPHLVHLELSRCTPRRRAARASAAGSSQGTTSGCGYGGYGVGGASGDGDGVASGLLGRGSAASTAAAAAIAAAGGGDGGDDGNDRAAAAVLGRSKRALLELCLTAPSLRRVLVVRSAGGGALSVGPDGPLGAEWVRRQLAGMGTRQDVLRPAREGEGKVMGTGKKGVEKLAAAPGCSSDGFGGGGGGGGSSSHGWPEVSWD